MIKECNKTTHFPDYLSLKINEDFVEEIRDRVKDYTQNLVEAHVYSYQEGRNIKSDSRKSYKTSFRDEKIEEFIKKRLLYPIQHSLNKKDNYLLSIAPQSFDYIKYENAGYFEDHKDFIRINHNYQQQYTLIIGLTQSGAYSGGKTVLWIPVDKESEDDYTNIIKTDDYSVLYNLFQKLKIPFYNKENLYSKRKDILSKKGLIPKYFESLKKGEALLFKSDILHSGEQFFSFECSKELLAITINITSINSSILEKDWLENENRNIMIWKEFQPWMIEYCHENNLIPFQYLISKGNYNDKDFIYTYTRYWNLDIDIFQPKNNHVIEGIKTVLQEIYEDAKKKLNHRHREYHIDSIVEESNEEIKKDFGRFKFQKRVEPQKSHVQIIDNFVKNLDVKIWEGEGEIIHKEKVKNTWEESGCNDDGDVYDDTTYLNCKVDILFGFCKY